VGTLSKLRRMVRRDGVSVREAATTAAHLPKHGGASGWPSRRWCSRSTRRVAGSQACWTHSGASWTSGSRPMRTAASATGAACGRTYEAIRALGYTGGKTQVYNYCSNWQQEQANAPRNAGFVPLSFELGEAFQFDWSCEYAFVGGLRRRLEVAHTKLAASRAFLLVAYFSQAHEMLFDAHTRGFQVLGGVPKRGIYDNMRTAVDKVGAGKQRSVNARFER
jgi:transposase